MLVQNGASSEARIWSGHLLITTQVLNLDLGFNLMVRTISAEFLGHVRAYVLSSSCCRLSRSPLIRTA